MKKVLFITYYWPPAGGTLINRVLKFYQFLPEYGWEPVILTVDGGFFAFVDGSLQQCVRSDTKVYKTKGFSFFGLLKIFTPKSSNTAVPYGFTDRSKKSLKNRILRWGKFNMVPDTKYPWRFGTVRKAISIVEEENIDLIFSSSPPQTNHVIAKAVAKRSGIPWVADFRDPWTDSFWLLDSTSLRWRVMHNWDKAMERRTMKHMNVVTTTGASMVKILKPKVKCEVIEITNGFDHTLYSNSAYLANTKFTITFAGSLSQQHNPRCFFESIDLLLKSGVSEDELDIVFMGNFPNYLQELIQEFSFRNCVRLESYMPFEEAVQVICRSEMLLVMIPNTVENALYIPLKIYDYLGSRRPILAYGPVEGDASALLDKTNAGRIFDYQDTHNAAAFLESVFAKWKCGQSTQNDSELVNQYTRRSLTEKLAKVFNDLVNDRKEVNQ